MAFKKLGDKALLFDKRTIGRLVLYVKNKLATIYAGFGIRA